jgi:hypothetical protein
MIPLFMHLKIQTPGKRRRVGLWIPLFLVWILLFCLVLLLLPFLLLAELVLCFTDYYIPVIRLTWYPFVLLAEMRGTEIHVSGNKSTKTGSIDISIV